MVLEQMAALNLPPLESMPPDQARAFMGRAQPRPARPAPTLARSSTASCPAPRGTLAYRLYRPASQGPHPVVVYFHGGGWVIGHLASDDPLCRDLCVRTDALVVSVNYRHAPEHRFPAAVDDGWAAVQWIADHAEELGGIPGRLVVCGWSAGAGIATVICQLARDAAGPTIVGQALLTPVTDSDQTRGSYLENADGYGLTAPVDAMVLRPLRRSGLSG